MHINKVNEPNERRARLSLLWIFVMLNMIVADIFSFMSPGVLKGLVTGSAEQITVTENFLLLAAVIIEIPIAMIVLSRILNDRANRWANLIAGPITILFVIGGGSTTLHYIFFATIEVLSIILIMWTARTWRKTERAHVIQPSLEARSR